MAIATVADADSRLTPKELADKYGLAPAGARPHLFAYVLQLWSYRHFMTTLATAEVVTGFTKARLGRLWQLLTPLSNVAVYYLIFGIVLDTKRGVHNFVSYLCIGFFIFQATREVMSAGTVSITRNLGLIRALHFPRASLPIAATLATFQETIASMIVLIAIVLITGEPITWLWLELVPVLLLQAVFNAGMAMIMGRLGNKITDVKQILPFLLRTWMYASGIMYSVATFSKHLPHRVPGLPSFVNPALWVESNPMVVYIELVRHALLQGEPVVITNHRLWILAFAWAGVAFVGGFIYFWRGETEYGRG
jgi:teichoic acid transport system permease protein